MSDPSQKLKPQRSSTGFGGIKQVSVGVSIGFPLMVVGTLMLGLLIVSKIGVTTSLFILAGALLVGGAIAAASHRIF
jgi:hypothetical protein